MNTYNVDVIGWCNLTVFQQTPAHQAILDAVRPLIEADGLTLDEPTSNDIQVPVQFSKSYTIEAANEDAAEDAADEMAFNDSSFFASHDKDSDVEFRVTLVDTATSA